MPDSTFRFAFDEIVRVVSDDPELAPVNGEMGVVLGRGEEALDDAYGVFIYREQQVWCMSARDLESTSRFELREEPTHALRVRVDEQGRGHVVGLPDL